MAGSAPDGELKTSFAVATAADDPALRELLRESPMKGSITIGFEREPEYFRGADLAGGKDQTIVARAGARLVCMGRSTLRQTWLNGTACPTGYLGELRLAPGIPGGVRILRAGYAFYRSLQQEHPATFYFTSIGSDNDRARRFLEKGVRGLPTYRFLGDLETLLVAVQTHAAPTRIKLVTATPEHLPAVVALLNEQGRGQQLAAVWTLDRLRALARHGLPLERFRVALDQGVIVACGGLWDQRGFRQTMIRGYSRSLTMLRPAINFASKLCNVPRLPEPGSVLSHAFLSPLALHQSAEVFLPELIAGFVPLAARLGIEFLTLALPADDPRLTVLRRRFSTRSWRSRLYEVSWPGHTMLHLDGPFLPDVALL